MEIVIVSAFHLFPCAAAEVGAVVAGGIAVLALSEVKIVPVFSLRIFKGFLKPLVLIGAVIDHQIHKDVHIPFFGFRKKGIKVLHGTEGFVNPVIVGNIIPFIHKRGLINRRKPDNIDPKLL